MKTKWCIALENIGPYIDPVLGERYKFLKGEPATKEKVFNMIPDITEEEYAKFFRPATEEEINGEFEWNGLQYILKKPKRMTVEEKAKRYDEIVKVADKYRDTHIMFSQIEDEMFPELAESKDEIIRKEIISAINEDWPGRTDWIAWLEKQQKPSEDEDREYACQSSEHYTRRELMIYNLGIADGKRMIEDEIKETEQKPAWSEEDEVMIKVFDSIIRYIVEVLDKDVLERFGTKREELFSWFESIKEKVQLQLQWKPSDEQLEALKLSTYCQDKKMSKVLFELYQDLKKLREE